LGEDEGGLGRKNFHARVLWRLNCRRSLGLPLCRRILRSSVGRGSLRIDADRTPLGRASRRFGLGGNR
ncbi:MAG TPA: hypothetical protein VGZ26_07385, partial [Pirellulales bacterium]|nr:hypothetical protein [Pirellulales bacterium]